jgi:hypothetical protein
MAGRTLREQSCQVHYRLLLRLGQTWGVAERTRPLLPNPCPFASAMPIRPTAVAAAELELELEIELEPELAPGLWHELSARAEQGRSAHHHHVQRTSCTFASQVHTCTWSVHM